MIPLKDCISALDKMEDSPEFTHLKNLSRATNKFKKEGGFRATQSFKKDGIYVHFEYADGVWRICALHLMAKKESGFSSYLGEIKSGVGLLDGRRALVAKLGPPSSSGGDGTIGQFGIVNRIWERWDYETYSIRLDYESDEEMVYTACLQRPTDVQEFEKRRANQSSHTTPASAPR